MTRLAVVCGGVLSSLRSRVGRDLPTRLVAVICLELLVALLLLFWMAVTVT